ncbi:MAG: DUF11 domain-containing protein [Acidobacteria bacterium]|nr:DUF11 domain-containing protein [Acidobacteriota bacterium]
MTMSVSPEAGVVGATLTYSLDLRNNGPDEVSGVQISDTLPSALSIVSATPSQGVCGRGGFIGCDLGSLPAGANATIEIQAVTLSAGEIVNHASVLSRQTDPVPSNNAASAAATITGGAVTARLAVRVVGRGSVMSSPGGIACPGDCVEEFPIDGRITLAAVPARGHRFAGWRGGCRGTGSCSLTMTSARQVTARFRRARS